MYKKGVSDVVATVIIIALVVVAITVVWLGVMPLIKDKIGGSDVCNDVDVSIESSQGYTCWASDQNLTLVQVKKGSSDAVVSKVKFAISSNGNSISYSNITNFQRNSYNIFYLNTTGFSSVDKVEVVPFVKSGNSEKACSAMFVENLKSCGPTALSPTEVAQIVSSGSVSNSDTTSVNGNTDQAINPPVNPPINPPVGFECNIQNGQGFFNGTGALASPYGICNCTMLQNMKNYLNANFSLLSNIDCSDTKNWNWNANIGGYNGFLPIGRGSGSFTGTADGNNYNITNLFINSSGTDYVGLFGAIVFDTVSAPANVSRFNLINASITGNKWVGGITGYSQGGSIKNCSYGGMVYGNYEVGGIAGRNYVGLVSSSFSNATIVGRYYALTTTMLGGLVGNNYGTGASSSSLILNSYAMGKVIPYRASDGGVAGLTNTQNSYSFVTNSYSTTNVSVATSGYGCVGNVFGGVISNTYWDSQTSGKTSGGGGAPRLTTQMQTSENYVNWDWNIWAIDSGKNNGYPYLRWQNL